MSKESPEIKTGRASQAGHWYDLDTGEAVYEVEKADGKGFRKVTLADAKKWHAKKIRRLGSGVTNINSILNKEELNDWAIKEAVRGVWAEVEEEGALGTYEDALRTAYAHLDELRSAKPGQEIHKAWEQFLRCEGIDYAYDLHVAAIADAIEPYGRAERDWHIEETAVHPLGYGCRVDLWRDGDKLHVFDIKSKPSVAVVDEIERVAKGKKPQLGYDSDIMQLAANAQAIAEIGYKNDPPGITKWDAFLLANVFVGREIVDGLVPVHVRVWTQQECEWGWQMFQATLAAWKISKRYDPTEPTP